MNALHITTIFINLLALFILIVFLRESEESKKDNFFLISSLGLVVTIAMLVLDFCMIFNLTF